jgi:AcrR family transcriptional regulator
VSLALVWKACSTSHDRAQQALLILKLPELTFFRFNGVAHRDLFTTMCRNLFRPSTTTLVLLVGCLAIPIRECYLIRMIRPVKHSEHRILEAAATIAAAHGPAAATVTAIAKALKAPSGSIYHRFNSRDDLLGRLWLTKATVFQDRWADALRHPDPRQAGLDAALSLPHTVRDDFEGARIMLLHRREDFINGPWPASMKGEAERLTAQVRNGLADITRRLFGANTKQMRETATFAVLDVPFAAVRRFVAMGEPPPRSMDALIASAYAAIIDPGVGAASRQSSAQEQRDE